MHVEMPSGIRSFFKRASIYYTFKITFGEMKISFKYFILHGMNDGSFQQNISIYGVIKK